MLKSRRKYGHYIAGEFISSHSGQTFESHNPTTEALLYTAARGDAVDVDRAVASARRAFGSDSWRALTPTKRGRLLYRLGELIGENAEQLAQIETLDNGKLIREMRAQLDKIPDYYFYHAGLADKIQGTVVPPYEKGSLAYTVREPLGVVGAIVPWNSPLLLATYKLAPALATGNTVVIKPSEHTSASVLELMALIEAAGFPAGVVNVVTGDGEAGHALASHPGVDKVAFTGGTSTGRIVGEAAIRHFARVTLELGGKSPQIVFEDADPQSTATGIISGIFAAAGQTCIAGSRAFLHTSVYDEIAEILIARTKRIVVGDPLDDTTDIGPLCFSAHRDRVADFVASGVNEGAELLAGGRRPEPERPGWFYLPTIFGDVSNSMTVAQQEVFGPVLSLIRWEDEAAMIRDANDSIYGLAAGLWTRDVARVHRVAEQLDAGTVWVNQYRASNPLVPFGGFKASGIGKENGTVAVDEYLRLKTVWINTSDRSPTDPFVIQK